MAGYSVARHDLAHQAGLRHGPFIAFANISILVDSD
jgi:hypothetical protein